MKISPAKHSVENPSEDSENCPEDGTNHADDRAENCGDYARSNAENAANQGDRNGKHQNANKYNDNGADGLGYHNDWEFAQPMIPKVYSKLKTCVFKTKSRILLRLCSYVYS